jgi:RNA polymerase sigma factor (sigma-70 family)
MNSLLIRARNGDSDAEKQLFQHLFVRFRAFATHRMREEEAEDVAQEACLAVLRKYKTETFTTGFNAWAYGVLKMEVRAHIRTQTSRTSRLDSKLETDQIAATSSTEAGYTLKMKLAHCLRKIIRHNRSYARVLNFIHQGYRSDEICRRLGVKPNNFYVILSRGRKLMKTCLSKGRI